MWLARGRQPHVSRLTAALGGSKSLWPRSRGCFPLRWWRRSVARRGRRSARVWRHEPRESYPLRAPSAHRPVSAVVVSSASGLHSCGHCRRSERSWLHFLFTPSSRRAPPAFRPLPVVVAPSLLRPNSSSRRPHVERHQRTFLVPLSAHRAHSAPIPGHAFVVSNASSVHFLARGRLSRTIARAHPGNVGTSPPPNRSHRLADRSRRARPPLPDRAVDRNVRLRSAHVCARATQ